MCVHIEEKVLQSFFLNRLLPVYMSSWPDVRRMDGEVKLPYQKNLNTEVAEWDVLLIFGAKCYY